MALPLCRLYLITPPRLDDLAAFGHALAGALDAGDVAALQIRLKDQPDEIIAAAVDVLAPIAQARGVALVVLPPPQAPRSSCTCSPRSAAGSASTRARISSACTPR